MTLASLPPPLEHPDLGQVQGRYGKGVIQYLGLKYASLEHRFAEPELATYDASSTIDGMKHGPPVPTFSGALDMEMSFIQASLPKTDVPAMSDTEGLNLNITVPNEGGRNLPVLVYIHGGGFTFGSGSYPHYDQSKVVELSVVMGQPIIAVNINYRLNIAGFLDSKELRGAGYAPNRGLRDQRTALLWVKKYISGFGGDPNLVTVVGQSAGAASVNFQMHSEEALFNQAILIGGSFLMMRPATEETAERLYKDISDELGLSDKSVEDRVKELETKPGESMLSNLTPALASLGPVVDGETVPAAATFAGLKDATGFPLPGYKWCKRVLVIDSQADGSIFGLVNLHARENTITSDFIAAVQEILGDAGQVVLDTYNVSPDTPPSTIIERAVQFVTDVAFYAPTIKVAEAWPGKSHVCHFNEGNPFPGLYEGRASHLLDTAYLWGNYNQTYPRRCWAVARAFAEDIVGFVTGQGNLPVFNAVGGEAMVRVYGPSAEGLAVQTVGGMDARTERNRGVFELADQAGGLDKLLEVVENLFKSV